MVVQYNIRKEIQVMVSAQTDKTYQFVGLSTDTKPTENLSNGSQFIEMDTGKVYFYSEDDGDWLEFGA